MKRGKDWEGFLLNLSSNCESRRAVLPVPKVVQSREELPPKVRAVDNDPILALSALWVFLSSITLLSPIELSLWDAWGRIAWVLRGPLLVSSTGDAGCTENVSRMSKCRLMKIPV